MKWVIFAVVAVAAIIHWGLMGAIWMSIVAAVMLENHEEKHL